MRHDLYITNTLTRRKERFQPREKDLVKMFTCGPSIYARPHIGNYRSFLYEDVLQRYLEYKGYKVQRLINFTDVEDKAIEKAMKKGLTLEKLTKPNANQFKKDTSILKIKLPSRIPRSSTSVRQSAQLVQKLIDKGHAYWHEGDVFYAPLTFRSFGRLYGLDMKRWPRKKIRFRKDTYPGQRWNRGDFILWFGDGKKGFTWKSEIGRGRPAWNIQDAAMITSHLGYQIDISCGGVDNLYRHHDYTIAIIEGITGREFSHYWLHGEHVLVDGVKMSKSKGNIVYLQDLLKKKFSADHIRFFLISHHYRRKLNLTKNKLEKAVEGLDSLRRLIRDIRKHSRGQKGGTEEAEELKRVFEERMNDDLDVNGAIKEIEKKLGEFTRSLHEGEAGQQECKMIISSIEKIDGVLQALT